MNVWQGNSSPRTSPLPMTLLLLLLFILSALGFIETHTHTHTLWRLLPTSASLFAISLQRPVVQAQCVNTKINYNISLVHLAIATVRLFFALSLSLPISLPFAYLMRSPAAHLTFKREIPPSKLWPPAMSPAESPNISRYRLRHRRYMHKHDHVSNNLASYRIWIHSSSQVPRWSHHH